VDPPPLDVDELVHFVISLTADAALSPAPFVALILTYLYWVLLVVNMVAVVAVLFSTRTYRPEAKPDDVDE
jgi:cation transporter-like permease